MRLSRPRIAPADYAALPPDVQATLDAHSGFAGRSGPLNVLTTIATAPVALKRYLQWSDYILGPRSDLSPRQRELVILRTGWLCRSGYEWAQHHVVGRECGLSEVEIARVKLGGAAPGWSTLEADLLGAVDELLSDHFIGETRWRALAALGDKGRMDLVFTCGQYAMVAMLLNSTGVQLEPGRPLDPDLAPRREDEERG